MPQDARSAATRAGLQAQGFTVVAKSPPPRNTGGRFPGTRFPVNLEHGRATCPAAKVTGILPCRL